MAQDDMVKRNMERISAKNTVCILSLLIVLVCFLAPLAVSADVSGTPILPNLTLHDSPQIGKPVRVTFEVTAMKDFSDVDIEFFVPDGVEWIQGDTMVTTSMEKGEKREFTATVNIIPEYWHTLEDNYQGRFIWAMAKATTPAGKCWRVFSTVMTPSGFVERSSGGTAGLEVLRARNRIGQPSKEEIEDVSKAVGLPDGPRYRRVASHLWFWELRQLWKSGYSEDESFRVIQDLGRYVARTRRVTQAEAIATIVNEALFGQLMERRDRLRAFWSPGKIVGIIAIVLLLLLLVVLRLTSSRRRVKA